MKKLLAILVALFPLSAFALEVGDMGLSGGYCTSKEAALEMSKLLAKNPEASAVEGCFIQTLMVELVAKVGINGLDEIWAANSNLGPVFILVEIPSENG